MGLGDGEGPVSGEEVVANATGLGDRAAAAGHSTPRRDRVADDHHTRATRRARSGMVATASATGVGRTGCGRNLCSRARLAVSTGTTSTGSTGTTGSPRGVATTATATADTRDTHRDGQGRRDARAT